MSKKRQISLKSKWKLNKELNDYKKHKQNKKAGGAGYLDEPEKVSGKHRRHYKTGVCKKTGKAHVWKKHPHKHNVMRDSYNFYKCEECGKEHLQAKHKYICTKCGAEESWLWVFINDSDKRVCRKCGNKKFKKIPNPNLENNNKKT